MSRSNKENREPDRVEIAPRRSTGSWDLDIAIGIINESLAPYIGRSGQSDDNGEKVQSPLAESPYGTTIGL